MKKQIFFIAAILALNSVSLARAENHFYSSIGKRASGYYSQFGQDQYLHETFFKGKTDGVFVDIGAHNGIAYSNTKFFEEIGWTGICVEPIPDVFKELKKNRSAICVEGCVFNKKGTAQFLFVNGAPEMLSGLVETYHPLHLQRAKNEIAAPNSEGGLEILQVNCYLLNDLLEENQLFHVDYLSIDTEGGEFEIIKSIDFSKFDIEIIDIENNYQDERMIQYITSMGYTKVCSLGCDEIFRKNR